MSLSISIIGVGRLGGALAVALSEKGYEIRQLIARQNKSAQKVAESISSPTEILTSDELEKISSEIVFITTPDAEIRTATENLARKLKYQPFVFHCSGALSSEVLRSLSEIGCRTASLHPLVAISDASTGAKRFKNAFFCVEGDGEASKVAEKIVADLEGKCFSVATRFKTLYHASAVMASGHLVALFAVAVESLAACGLNEKKAQEIIFPLVKSTIENLSTQTPAQALTGPFARADVETLRRHLETLLENMPPEVIGLYRQLGMRSVQLAERQGVDAEKLAEIKGLLMENDRRIIEN